MDANSNEELHKGLEMFGEAGISSYISDHDSIHYYNDGNDSDTSNEKSQSDQDSETDEEENSTLDEDEYATFRNRIKIKRGRSIGLSFKSNGYLIPNRQLSHLLRARKLVLYGPFNADELNAPLGESNFCPSLQDVLWRSSGLKFRANGRATVILKNPHLKKVLSSASTGQKESSDENNTNISLEYLRRLGVSLTQMAPLSKTPTLKTLLDTGKIVLDKPTRGYYLPNFSKSNGGAHFEYRFEESSMFFFVSRPTSEIVLGFDQQHKTSRRNLKKGLYKSDGTGEIQGDRVIPDIGFIPVNDYDLEVLGSTRFIISLSDLVFAKADEKKLLLSHSPHSLNPATSINCLLSMLQKNDSCKILNSKCANSATSSDTGDSEFAAKKTNISRTDSESDPNILNTVPIEEANSLVQKFKTTISQACPGYPKGVRPKYRPKRSPLGSRSTISLPPWSSVKFTYTPVCRISAKLRRVENVLVKVNKRAIMIINISTKVLIYSEDPKRCICRLEISTYLERTNANSNPDGILWTLLLPFYIRGETPNRAEMSVIAGQVPQIEDQRPNWDSPTAKLKTILHSGILGAFPLELFFRGSFWQWLIYEGAPHIRQMRPGPEEYELPE
nr:MAT1-2-5 [Pseudogymnoascus sp. 23342-1-I1]